MEFKQSFRLQAVIIICCLEQRVPFSFLNSEMTLFELLTEFHSPDNLFIGSLLFSTSIFWQFGGKFNSSINPGYCSFPINTSDTFNQCNNIPRFPGAMIFPGTCLHIEPEAWFLIFSQRRVNIIDPFGFGCATHLNS